MKLVIYIFITIFCMNAYSNEWVSPIDIKYSTQHPDNFKLFAQSRDILDSWRGEQNKLNQAYQLLETILRKDQSFAPAYRELGRLYIMAGYINSNRLNKSSTNVAEIAVLKSIEIEPNYADSFMLLGHIYTITKQYELAESHLTRAENIGTQSPWLFINWGTLDAYEGRNKDALKRFQHIVSLGTSNKKAYSSALHGVTQAYVDLRQYDKANESYKAELSYEPENAWNWGNYASFLLFNYNNVDGAIKYGRKALSIKNYGLARFNLACALYTKWAILLNQNENVAEAKLYFDKAFILEPDLVSVLRETQKYTYTNITARELQKKLN